MENKENQRLNTNLNADQTTDVTRSQNREAAAASQEGKGPHMGTASEDTGSRPSNNDQDNQKAANPHQNAEGSHREGQYPRNNENRNLQDVKQAQAGQQDKREAQQESEQYTQEARKESEGLIGKPGDKPE